MNCQRIRLKKGKQKELIEKTKSKNNFTWKQFAGVLVINTSYLCHELRSEKRLLRKDLFQKICNLVNEDYSFFIEEILDSNWGQMKGGSNSNAGGKGEVKIKIPELNSRFSELLGAYLGDGTLTKYFMRITADHRYSLPYLQYLASIVEESLGIKPSIRIPSNRNIAYLEIRSKQFSDYLKEEFGFSFGDKIKNKQRIPEQILKDQRLSIACLRGLMDTDGSISKRGNQLCLEFTSKNPVLLDQVWKIGTRLGVFTHQSKEQVGTNSWPKIVRYFNLVGSSDRIHIIRFNEKFCDNKLLYKKDLFAYFKKYDGVLLPFRGLWSIGMTPP